MTDKLKRLLLVYPPFAGITSPPMGVCMLKGYVERVLPGWEVKILDLNIALHEAFFEQRPRTGSRAAPEPEEKTLRQAIETFRGGHNEDFFNRPDLYERHAALLLGLIERNLSGSLMLRRFCRGTDLSPPPLLEQKVKIFLDFKPDALGFSVGYNRQMWVALSLAKIFKQYSTAPVIFGGSAFNADASQFVTEYPAIDYLISGEGEKPLVELLKSLGDPGPIPGLSLRGKAGIETCPPEFEKNPDLLGHPDFSGLDLKRYFSPVPVLPILTSRGCYWRRCAFCVHYRSAGLTYRTNSTGHVLTELRHHVENGIRHFALIDEMISPSHFAKLAEGIISAGLKLHYYALAKPVKAFTPELLARMAASGCRYVLWGVESGSQRLLDLMDKGTRVEEVESTLQTAHAAGIRNHVYLMAGFPTETRAEFQETLNLLERNRNAISAVHRGIFSLEKHSPVYDNPKKFGIKEITAHRGNFAPVVYKYQCAAGMRSREIADAFNTALPFLRSFSFYSRYLNNFRDHALLLYSHLKEHPVDMG